MFHLVLLIAIGIFSIYNISFAEGIQINLKNGKSIEAMEISYSADFGKFTISDFNSSHIVIPIDSISKIEFNCLNSIESAKENKELKSEIESAQENKELKSENEELNKQINELTLKNKRISEKVDISSNTIQILQRQILEKDEKISELNNIVLNVNKISKEKALEKQNKAVSQSTIIQNQKVEETGSIEQALIVYITKTGKKYHRDGCRSLRRSKIPISLKDAINRGYSPCSICNPPTEY